MFFTAVLIPLDYIMVVISFLAAYAFRDYLDEVFLMPLSSFIKIALLIGLAWVFVSALMGLYSFSFKRRSLNEFLKVILASSAAATFTSAGMFLLHQLAFSRLVLMIAYIISIFGVLLARFLVGMVQLTLYHRGFGITRVLIVGDGESLQSVLVGLKAQANPSREIIGVVSDSFKKNSRIEGFKVLGRFDKLNQIFNEIRPAEIIQANPFFSDKKRQEVFNLCEKSGVEFKFVPDIFKVDFAKVATYDLAGLPLIELQPTTLTGWPVVVKRISDIMISLLALIITSPLLLLTVISIKIDSPGSILFRHRRVGKNGKEFDLYKFRSMQMFRKDGKLVHASEFEEVEKLKEATRSYKLEYDPRITRVGRFIRKTSIDELPQFFNVLRGQMSVVGPRAYLRREFKIQQQKYPHAEELIRKLLTVEPGVTGIWQVSGRSKIDFSERVAMDAYYATHANFWMDLKIILQTIPVILKGSGAM